MIKIEFIGYVEKVFPPTQYDQSIAVRNWKDDADKETLKINRDYPVCYRFTAKTKNNENEQFNGLAAGDKVKINAYLTGRSGISKRGDYYCMNEILISKKGGVTVLLKNSPSSAPKQADQTNDMPF